jgi:hypothetical protein
MVDNFSMSVPGYLKAKDTLFIDLSVDRLIEIYDTALRFEIVELIIQYRQALIGKIDISNVVMVTYDISYSIACF